MRAWETLDRIESPDGALELRRRGDDYLIAVDGRVLMNSHANRSEVALAAHALAHLRGASTPRILVGGLGMGCTLRAALDRLPPAARVEVSEKNAAIVDWCAGALAAVNENALADPRVRVAVEDVADRIGASRACFDAILLDLYEGPHAKTDADADPFYGRRALERTRAALAPGGVFAVWSEDRDAGFEARLRAGGFAVAPHRPGRGGRRHAVTVARAPGSNGF